VKLALLRAFCTLCLETVISFSLARCSEAYRVIRLPYSKIPCSASRSQQPLDKRLTDARLHWRRPPYGFTDLVGYRWDPSNGIHRLSGCYPFSSPDYSLFAIFLRCCANVSLCSPLYYRGRPLSPFTRIHPPAHPPKLATKLKECTKDEPYA
jgi:hypothetical protein